MRATKKDLINVTISNLNAIIESMFDGPQIAILTAAINVLKKLKSEL